MATISDNTVTGEYEIVESYRYDEYGEPYFYNGNGGALYANKSQADQDYLFTGRQWDAELGLFFYRARYFRPNVGSFMSRDSYRADLLYNMYAYVNESPVDALDPFGHQGTNQAGAHAQYTAENQLLSDAITQSASGNSAAFGPYDFSLLLGPVTIEDGGVPDGGIAYSTCGHNIRISRSTLTRALASPGPYWAKVCTILLSLLHEIAHQQSNCEGNTANLASFYLSFFKDCKSLESTLDANYNFMKRSTDLSATLNININLAQQIVIRYLNWTKGKVPILEWMSTQTDLLDVNTIDHHNSDMRPSSPRRVIGKRAAMLVPSDGCVAPGARSEYGAGIRVAAVRLRSDDDLALK